MNTPHRPNEADFWSNVPFSRTGMRFFNGLGCTVPLLNTSHFTPKSDVEFTVPATLRIVCSRQFEYRLRFGSRTCLFSRPRARADDLGWLRAADRSCSPASRDLGTVSAPSGHQSPRSGGPTARGVFTKSLSSSTKLLKIYCEKKSLLRGLHCRNI